MQETWVQSLGREDSLKKEVATTPVLFLENPMDGGAWCPWGRKELDMTERLHFNFHGHSKKKQRKIKGCSHTLHSETKVDCILV